MGTLCIHLLTYFLLCGFFCLQAVGSFAQETHNQPRWRHATALSGTPKYPKDFPFFDYVCPDAPKTGRVRLSSTGGFDNFNVALPQGKLAPGIGLLYETLMTPSMDEMEISAAYGLIAEAIRYPEDFSWAEFRLNPIARWHDGTPITGEDVIWSFRQLVALNPTLRFYYRNVIDVIKVDERIVRFVFDITGNRELPHILGQFPILPRHWWRGQEEIGDKPDISKTSLTPPLGSGPYRIKSYEASRHIVYERVPDYWAKDHPTQRGHYNFDTVRYDVYQDETVALEAFKADQYDFRIETSIKNWATGYDFPAQRRGEVILETFPDFSVGIMQAFAPNLRRDPFRDRRVRRALNYAFDFETLNRTVFYGRYKRINSYFSGTSLKASGLPEGKEREILETVREHVPPEVFTQAYENPVGGSPQAVRKNLRKALTLLAEAGWTLKNGKLINTQTGAPFKDIEILYYSPLFESVILSYQSLLKKIGITLIPRFVDTTQYINRLQSRNFDLAIINWAQTPSPGNEQRDFWGSTSADRPHSRNYLGIKDPAVDALIDKIIFAEDRETLVAATHALDRVLLWNYFVIPQWYLGDINTARWNRFAHPENIPPFGTGFPDIWWWKSPGH